MRSARAAQTRRRRCLILTSFQSRPQTLLRLAPFWPTVSSRLSSRASAASPRFLGICGVATLAESVTPALRGRPPPPFPSTLCSSSITHYFFPSAGHFNPFSPSHLLIFIPPPQLHWSFTQAPVPSGTEASVSQSLASNTNLVRPVLPQ